MKTFTQADLVSFGNYLLSDERKDLVMSHPQWKPESLKNVGDGDLASWGMRQKKGKTESSGVSLRDFYAVTVLGSLMSNQGSRVRMTPLSRLKYWLGGKGWCSDWRADYDYNAEQIAEKTFEIADQVLKARNK